MRRPAPWLPFVAPPTTLFVNVLDVITTPLLPMSKIAAPSPCAKLVQLVAVAAAGRTAAGGVTARVCGERIVGKRDEAERPG